MRAYVEAYGCTLNFGESREIEDGLCGLGWELTDDPGAADLAVLVTCVVVDKTERAMLKRARELSHVPRLMVTGCMAAACREKAAHAVPKAEFAPPGEISSVLSVAGPAGGPLPRPHRELGSYAIVPVATGCLGSCSYCITRLARGGLRSRAPDSVVQNVRDAVADGPREVRLTAQDIASYGSDIGTGLPELVRRICSIPSDFRVRVGMMNPASVMPVLDGIVGMFGEPKVFKFMHLPVQSGSDRVLGDMERRYTVADFERIVKAVRAEFPDVSLSTDLIIGYPGEDADDHRANVDLVARVRPDIVNVTKFSPRPGTGAGSRKAVVGWKTKDRSREVTEVRFRVALEVNSSFIGKTVRAMATERGKRDTTLMRTDEYRQIVVSGGVPLGSFHDVTVTDATPTYLMGELEAS